MTDEAPLGAAESARTTESDISRLLEAMQSEQAHEAPEMPDELRHLDEKRTLQEIELKREHSRQEIKLREKYAKWLLVILAAELVIVNVIYWLYAELGKNWNLPEGVIEIWLGATVVQVVGVVTVVTRYLFPRRDMSND
jgi:hypothetical protein